MGGNAEENTAFRPMCLTQGRKAFVLVMKIITKLLKTRMKL